MNDKPKCEPVVDFNRAAKRKHGLDKLAELREKFGLKGKSDGTK